MNEEEVRFIVQVVRIGVGADDLKTDEIAKLLLPVYVLLTRCILDEFC